MNAISVIAVSIFIDRKSGITHFLCPIQNISVGSYELKSWSMIPLNNQNQWVSQEIAGMIVDSSDILLVTISLDAADFSDQCT